MSPLEKMREGLLQMAEGCIELQAQLEKGEQTRPEALTVTMAAKRLNYSPSTIRNMIADGRLHALNVGGHKRIPSSEITRILGGVGE